MPRDIIKEANRRSFILHHSDDEPDSMLDDAVRLVAEHDKASASLLQRRLSLGYARAARILDQLEQAGVVGPAEGARPREVLISSYEDYEHKSFKKPTVEPAEVDPDFTSYRAPDWNMLVKNPASKKLLEHLSQWSFPIGWENEKLLTGSLTKIPHLIITGSPHSNKLEYLDTLLTSLLSFESPADLRFILLDGAYFLHTYNTIPHLLTPVVSEPDKALSALRWTVAETEHRLVTFARSGCRDIASYNKTIPTPLFHIVCVMTQVGEFLSYAQKEITEALKKLTSLGERAGIHFILVSDSLASHAIPKEIQDNIPAVISFKTTWDGSSKPRDSEDLKLTELLYKNDADNSITKLRAPLLVETDIQLILSDLKK